MHLTFYSILMANLFVSVFTLLFIFLRNNISFILNFGTNSILILYLMCVVRILFPFELPFTREIYLPKLMNWWNHYLYLNVGSTDFMIVHIVYIVWLLVALFMLIRFTKAYGKILSAVKYIPFSQNPLVDSCIAEYSTNQNVKYCFVSKKAINSPVQIGILNPVILFPDFNYSESELRYICHHECTHINSHDNMLKTLTRLLVCIFWWNPFCYLLSDELNKMQEYRCDFIVTSALSSEERASYLEILLKVYSNDKNKHVFANSSCFSAYTGKTTMLNRFQLIANTKSPDYFLAKYAILICLCLFMSSYCFVIQPYFEPDVQEGELLDNTNTMLRQLEDGQYEVIIDGESSFIISNELATQMHENGIPYYDTKYINKK